MSENLSSKDSEDEFQDAKADVPSDKRLNSTHTNEQLDESTCSSSSFSSLKTNDDVIEEITRQQTDLKLCDYNQADEDNERKRTDDESDKVSQLFEEDIDVEELLEREKKMSADELQANKEKSVRMKLEANEMFKEGEVLCAVDIYTKALHICPTQNTKERAILYGNRAAAKIKLDSLKSALADCTKAIELWPEYIRVLNRRAKLYELENHLEDALADYQKVCELDPSAKDAREAVARLPEQINERNERLKTEMFSKLKDLGNMVLKPFGLSTDNFKMQQDPQTGSYSVNFQQNP